MSMEAFDTLAFAKKLKNAGVPEKQAEAMAEVQADTFRGMIDSSLVTKSVLKEEIAAVRSDLKDVESVLKEEIAAVRTELHTEMAGLRSELYKALLTQTFALIAAMVAIAGAFKLFG